MRTLPAGAPACLPAGRRVVNNLKLKLKAFEAELVRDDPRVRRSRSKMG